jgi:periplasmic glucans biosynthesis protein
LRRRDVVLGALAAPFVLKLSQPLVFPARAADKTLFDPASVRRMARELAGKPFKAPDNKLPDSLKDLSYDKYRGIRFVPDKALWRGLNLPFEAQFFHRGFFYKERVDLFEVIQGTVQPIRYSPSLFTFGEVAPPPADADLGFAGFRLHAPMNRPDYYDEVAVFLGASYFRAIAKNEVYGLSARGLSINTADVKGEEFPAFRAFWIERPQAGINSCVVHALLDSQSAAAAFRFTIRPGETTVFDVESTIYPRVDIAQAGVGTLTSMFLFDANDRVDVDDFRPAVHDSDGLGMRNGRGEQLWRPLVNPRDLEISTFADTNPRGFGLMQRQRDFRTYEDLEARYEKRPSAWVEPIGDWGEGAVMLVEIPTKEEIHDNIVAFWRPREPLKAKSEYSGTFRIHWGSGKSPPGLPAEVVKTRVGAGPNKTRLFVIDLAGDMLKGVPDNEVRGDVWAEKGKLANVVTQPNAETGGWRLSFELAPDNAPTVELRAQLMRGDTPLSEVWTYRWTA